MQLVGTVLWVLVCARVSAVTYEGRSCPKGQRLVQLTAQPRLLANSVRGIRFTSLCAPFEKPECVKQCEWGANCGAVAYRNNWETDAHKLAYYIRGWNASVTFNGRFRNIILQCCQSKSAVFGFCKASERVGTNGFRFRTSDDPIVASSSDGQTTDVVGMDVKIIKISRGKNQQMASLTELCLVHKMEDCKARLKNDLTDGKGGLRILVDDVAGSPDIPPPLAPVGGAGAAVGTALGVGLGVGIPLLCLGCPDRTFGDATGYSVGVITPTGTVAYAYSAGALGTTHPIGSTLTVSCIPTASLVGTFTDNSPQNNANFALTETLECRADRRWYFNGQPVNLVVCL